MYILDGKKTAEKITSQLKNILKNMSQQPGLGIILVGDRPDSKVYIKMKKKECEKLGIINFDVGLSEASTEKQVIEEIHKMNQDPQIHAILIQLPLPEHLKARERIILNEISIEKDVEGFHALNVGNLCLNANLDISMCYPCTPIGCMELLKEYNIALKGKHVVIVGKSNTVGLPLGLLCLHENATVSFCHIFTEDLKSHTQRADILIVACGKAHLIGADHIKEGVIIIDIGINKVLDQSSPKGYKLVGDVDFEAVRDKVAAISPVPGGVGPMTIAMLMRNTICLANKILEECMII